MIPFVLAPLVNTAIGALEIFLGLVPAGVLDAGWATPQPIKAFLSTSGAWQSIVSQIGNHRSNPYLSAICHRSK